MEKRKHALTVTYTNHESSLNLARFFFSLTFLYALAAIFRPPLFSTWYETFAGMTMMLFLPCIALCMFLFLIWKDHRMNGNRLAAQATKWTLIALCLIMVSALRLTFFAVL